MPTVTKLDVRPKTNGVVMQQPSSGSVLSGAVSVTRLKNREMNVLVYGGNGVGKTTFLCRFPKPLLILSFEPGEEGGAQSVAGTVGVTFIRVTSKAQAVAIARGLKQDNRSNWVRRGDTFEEVVDQHGDPVFSGDQFETHGLDTCTSLQNNVIMKELMNLEDAPVQLKWGSVPDGVYQDRSSQAKEVIQLFVNLPVNTILLAQEKDHNKPSDSGRKALTSGLGTTSYLAADMGQATVQWMHDACGYICRLYLAPETREEHTQIEIVPGQVTDNVQVIETGRTVRRLRTMAHNNFAARFRSNNPDAIPEWIEARTPQAMYDQLMQVVGGERCVGGKYLED